MIIRGTVSNGGWTSPHEPGELMVRISVDEMSQSEQLSPSTMRGRSVVLVLGNSPELPDSFYHLSQPEAVDSGNSDDGLTVEEAATAPKVGESDV